jgi:hypothetical protein
MKAVKSFDFFQKISSDEFIKPTIFGAFVSLGAISLMVYLVFRELVDLFSNSITKETILYQDPEQYSKINLNIAAHFRYMPCHIISVDQQDSIGNHRMDINDSISKKKIGRGPGAGQQYTPDPHFQPQELEDAIKTNQGCFVNGYVPITKVSGNVHISHHNYGNMYQHFKYHKREMFDKLSLSHGFNTLYFGDNEVKDELLRRFNLDEKTSFNRVTLMTDYRDKKEKMNYDYFIKLIPHLFVDKIRGEQFMAYQYSVTSKTTEFNPNSEGMHTLTLHYDFTPITMKIVLERKSITHSLTHICAIVGGVYVLFSLLNRLILAFCDWREEKSS